MLKGRLEALRATLYTALEEANMEQGHPRVLEASVAFDHALNQYLRHKGDHQQEGAGRAFPDRFLIVG